MYVNQKVVALHSRKKVKYWIILIEFSTIFSSLKLKTAFCFDNFCNVKIGKLFPLRCAIHRYLKDIFIIWVVCNVACFMCIWRCACAVTHLICWSLFSTDHAKHISQTELNTDLDKINKNEFQPSLVEYLQFLIFLQFSAITINLSFIPKRLVLYLITN